ncbi:metal ABC transporter permease [Tranquillimonas alkanivorans]|uniref:High-affinity zinc uptake system membrane protein ZnuB n=1 Tax=Tranquillimonas alkanivorans TaxID=441119 RepID=A0A1I5KIS9_9RHOB|nr:metal ABC transporter permease [Tranquillimonas alkanivorans]SFO84586.1 zinc transport system permease protein [Tranquillimonas alkanivorans]
MLDDFLVRAALASLGVALAAGILGCFVVWRRMAYFGDATAHAALLGVALSLFAQVSVFTGVLFVAVVVALVVSGLARRGASYDSTLGVMAHGSLGVGLLAVSLLPGRAMNPETYLFGDILAVGRTDLGLIWAGVALVTGLILWRWSRLLTATLNPDLAQSSGVNPHRESLVLTMALAVVVAVAIKVVGALLITALLIIPAAAARPLARTPEAMAAIAVALGMTSALGGLRLAWVLDAPAGPSIVCVAVGLFAATTLWGLLRRR